VHGVGVPREAEEEREEAAERGTRRNGVAAAMRVHGPRLFFSEFFFCLWASGPRLGNENSEWARLGQGLPYRW
jgi:hypothetical protein